MDTLGGRLRLLREENKKGQKELAVLLRVSISSIGKYENNERTPCPAAITKLADFYGVSADFLLGRSDIRLTAEQVMTAYNLQENLPQEAFKEFEELKNYLIHKYSK